MTGGCGGAAGRSEGCRRTARETLRYWRAWPGQEKMAVQKVQAPAQPFAALARPDRQMISPPAAPIAEVFMLTRIRRRDKSWHGTQVTKARGI